MVVEVEEASEVSLCMILPSKTDGLCVSGRTAWCPLDSFNDHLVGESLFGIGKKINKVYGFSTNRSAHELSIYERKLLWERPTYYNGKVVCISLNGFNGAHYTVGKIYEFKDGRMLADNGHELPSSKRIESFKDWCKFTNSQFIEVVE